MSIYAFDADADANADAGTDIDADADADADVTRQLVTPENYTRHSVQFIIIIIVAILVIVPFPQAEHRKTFHNRGKKLHSEV